MEHHTKKRASAEQFESMLVALERSPTMLNVRAGNTPLYGELWQALADRLNGMGVAKTAAKWQQAWRDWKSNTKKKAAKILEEKGKTIDGKPTVQPLTDLEVRVLNLADFMKPPEIDISNIADLDPLSSDERSRGSGSDEPFLCSPDLVTVYSVADGGAPVKTEGDSPPHKRAKSRHHSRKPKRHRIEFRQSSFGAEHFRKETSELLRRLTTLEAGRQASEERTNAALERIARALDDNTAAMSQQAGAAERQARALDRLAAAVETRYVYGNVHSGPS